jgi:hypothetical protein
MSDSVGPDFGQWIILFILFGLFFFGSTEIEGLSGQPTD